MTDVQSTTSSHLHPTLLALSIGALGVVYGDIGTSPLYAMRECFTGDHGVEPTAAHVLGVTSLVLWALILIVSIKYLSIVLRADNRGEGGILALMALAKGRNSNDGKETRTLLFIGLFGAALLYGDGMITPAISVLSAVEGLPVAVPALEPYVIPITLGILVLLFSLQRHGSARLGAAFGPILFVWFVTLGVLGLVQVISDPSVLGAINPLHGADYLFREGWRGFLVLGSIFLAVTGAEALYADMGHFGKRPIRIGWFCVALPGLALNYLGQASLILNDPTTAENPFFLLAPSWLRLPLVVLASIAAIIASQALISGAFSITNQAIQLGYLPRIAIRHTSSRQIGQIYIPWLNNFLLVSTILLVLGFGSSKSMASAYGIAVSFTMLLTTSLVYVVMRDVWQWSRARTLAVVGVFFLIELAFFTANALKFFHGGWVPIVIAGSIFALMTTWRRGREILTDKLRNHSVGLDQFFQAIKYDSPHRVPGTAVFMTRNPDGVPPALLHNLKHNKVLHERVIFLTVQTERAPYVTREERTQVDKLSAGFYRVIVHFGFVEKPLLCPALRLTAEHGLTIDPEQTTFFLGSETLLPREGNDGMAVWREHLFALMTRNAQKAPNFYELPPQQVIEVGLQLEI